MAALFKRHRLLLGGLALVLAVWCWQSRNSRFTPERWAAAGEGGRAGMRLARRDGRAVITVWDSGAGFTPEADENTLLQRPGSLGLGLRVARRIAAAHGGTIVVQQQEGRGSRAVVSLPLRPPEKGEVLKTPAMGFDGSGGFSDVLVELSGVLPYRAFLPEDLE